jgi:hypothetical protein
VSIKSLGKQSLVYGIGHILARLVTFLLLPLYTVGIYNAGYKIGMLMMLAVTAFNFRWQPLFLEQGKVSNKSFKYLDFVVSQDPRAENPLTPQSSLIRFKEEFGSFGLVRKVYQKDYK